MDKFKYALIGCGRISNKHIEAAISSNLEIVALCDTNINKANNLKTKYNLITTKTYFDFETMIKAEAPDIVAIATDSGSHAQIAIKCISSNINVLIEKPIALSMVDANRIAALVETKHVVVAVCHQNRLNPAVAYVKKIIY